MDRRTRSQRLQVTRPAAGAGEPLGTRGGHVPQLAGDVMGTGAQPAIDRDRAAVQPDFNRRLRLRRVGKRQDCRPLQSVCIFVRRGVAAVIAVNQPAAVQLSQFYLF